jgi:hypothetical protein
MSGPERVPSGEGSWRLGVALSPPGRLRVRPPLPKSPVRLSTWASSSASAFARWGAGSAAARQEDMPTINLFVIPVTRVATVHE